jgi:hypothetical protein
MGIPGVIGEIQQQARRLIRHVAAEAEVFASRSGSAALDRLGALLELKIIPS